MNDETVLDQPQADETPKAEGQVNNETPESTKKKTILGTAGAAGIAAAAGFGIGAAAAIAPRFVFPHVNDDGELVDDEGKLIDEDLPEEVILDDEMIDEAEGVLDDSEEILFETEENDEPGELEFMDASERLMGHTMDVATGVDDSMSFSQAFATARHEVGAGGLFVWRGNTYGTYYANEWNSMSAEDKDQYWSDVYHTTSHLNSNSEPEPEPELELEPEADQVEGSTLVLTEDDVYDVYDVDDDGHADIAFVNANDNDIDDVILDTTGDGHFDLLIVDPVEGEDGEVVPAAVVDIDDVIVTDEGILPNDDSILTEHPDIDDSDDVAIDLDIHIDNDMDMSDFG